MNRLLKKRTALWEAAILFAALLLGSCEMAGNPGSTPEDSPEQPGQTAQYALNVLKEGALLTEFVFPAVYPGYGEAASLEAAIRNTGTGAAGKIAIGLSGIGADAFEVSPAVIEQLEAGASASFTVRPKTGLGSGEYHASVSITDPQGTQASFVNVKFTVSTTQGERIKKGLKE